MTKFQNLKDRVTSLKTTSTEEQFLLFSQIDLLEKDQNRSDFKLQRLEKDRSIAVNLLEESVKDLAQQRDLIAANNQLLRNQSIALEESTSKLSRSLQALELSYDELEKITVMASHDLKTPLRTIHSFAQLLEKKYWNSFDEEGKKYLQFIMNGTTKMNEVMNSFVNYTETNLNDDDFIQNDLNELVYLAIENLKLDIKNTQTMIQNQSLPSIMSHKSGMINLFQHLIENAIKFAKPNTAPNISIFSQMLNNQWVFSVTDNGMGIDERYKEKIFQPFQRINNLEKPGTGIGLALCKKIVQFHRGDIWFNSKIGEGTTFNFTIPS
jgi:chemotaxis family two-component system sensor kinase Cph1